MPPVIRSKGGAANKLPIEKSYEQWSRFENFLKFAEKKELKDRLKELDPPPMTNYVDGATIDSINKARRDPASLVKKASGNTKDSADQKAENLANNKKRVEKMKQMYQMFVKMEQGKDALDTEGPEQDDIPEKTLPVGQQTFLPPRPPQQPSQQYQLQA